MARGAKEDIFELPCAYPLKVVGKNTNEFYAAVASIIERHLPEGREVTYSSRKSNGDKYLAITATFIMESREQMEAIYGDLRKNPLVVMTL